MRNERQALIKKETQGLKRNKIQGLVKNERQELVKKERQVPNKNEKQGLIRKVRQALIKKELGKEYIRTEKGRKKRTDSESKTNID